MSIRANDVVMPTAIGRGDYHGLSLTDDQRAFYADIEALPIRRAHKRTEQVCIRCRCGEVYQVRYHEAYLSEVPRKAGSAYTLHLERAHKYVPCPACGRDDGHTVPARVVPG